jgi:ketosteroid isomerase-like protein
MKKILLCVSAGVLLLSCNSKTESTTATSPDSTAATTPAVALPYTASYASNFTTDVSDADLNMVLMTYKDWADGSIPNLSNSIADSIAVEFSSGDHFSGTKADLMKLWGTYRDSLSSVIIDMQGWQKMYAPDKKEAHIVTWYKETDTYKSGKVDSAYFHDINRVKDGKITWYSQYKRPAK